MAVSGVIKRHGDDAANDLPDSSVTTLPTHRFESLDGLRGLAALVVVFTHGMLTLPHYWSLVIGSPTEQMKQFDWILLYSPVRLFWSGDNAVTLFFVISGFVLALPWVRGAGRTYGVFFVSRICRIYLPYCAAMFIAGAFAISFGAAHINGANDWINHYAWENNVSPYSVPSILLMLANPYSTWIDNPTWTLVVEMRVSLLFPLLVIPVARWGIKGSAAVAVVLWAAFLWSTSLESAFPSATAFIGNPHSMFSYGGFFLLGATLARYRNTLINVTHRFGNVTAIALVIVAFGIWTVKWKVDVMRGLGAALLVVAAITAGLPQRWLTAKPIQWLGKVSYSLYLTHVPVILLAEHLIYPRLPHIAIVAIAIPAALVTAEIFYRAVEKPAHDLGKFLTKRMSNRLSTNRLASY